LARNRSEDNPNTSDEGRSPNGSYQQKAWNGGIAVVNPDRSGKIIYQGREERADSDKQQQRATQYF
jgi:hypothetical protein